MKTVFEEHGYVVVEQWLSGQALQELKSLLLGFHQCWKQQHEECYQNKAINSAYLTRADFLSVPQRQQLFDFLAQPKLVALVTTFLGEHAVFFNTQLFFNPLDPKQKNYWHRDPQYHLNLQQQRAALSGPQVLHFRLALEDEPGIELVPGSHTRWDTDEELAVRLEHNGAKNWHSLPSGLEVPLRAGDLLIFSANMLHRGLYGLQRFAFDTLFAENSPVFANFIQQDCLPTPQIMQGLAAPELFENSWELSVAPRG